ARPIMVTAILPRFFTEGDKVRVSANVSNGTDAPQTVRVHLKADNGKVDAEPPVSESGGVGGLGVCLAARAEAFQDSGRGLPRLASAFTSRITSTFPGVGL